MTTGSMELRDFALALAKASKYSITASGTSYHRGFSLEHPLFDRVGLCLVINWINFKSQDFENSIILRAKDLALSSPTNWRPSTHVSIASATASIWVSRWMLKLLLPALYHCSSDLSIVERRELESWSSELVSKKTVGYTDSVEFIAFTIKTEAYSFFLLLDRYELIFAWSLTVSEY